jgi:membrane protein required for colicin V production
VSDAAAVTYQALTDWVLLAVLALSLLVGLWRGLVFEVLSLLGWIAAFFAAQWFAPDVADWLPLSTASPPARFAAAFVLTFVGAVFLAGLIAALVKKLVAAVGLRPVDRVLGALFGAVRGLVLLLVATVAIEMTPLHTSSWWQESRGAPWLLAALQGLKPALPSQFARYLN